MDLELVQREVSSLVSPGTPGLAVAVYQGGAPLLTAAAGTACLEFGVPIDGDTRFDIASSSKQFTAACVLLLARDGKLSLDDDVRTHVPELSLTVPVTLRQCLQHTGGLPEWYALQALTGDPLAEMTEERLLEVIARLRTTTFAPGTDFSYSNTGFVLAAVVVRRVSGQSLADFARERIFTPLGMDDSIFRDDAGVPLARMAYGYDNHGHPPRRADTEESAVGDGGLVTSVRDLAPWFGFLADGRVLGADLRDVLQERAVLADGTTLPYACGIYHHDVAGRAAVRHAGGMHGYLSELLYVPGEDLGVAVLSNQRDLDPVRLAERLVRLLLGEPETAAAHEPARLPVPEHAHWHDPVSDTVMTIEEATNERIKVKDVAEFLAGADGRWHGMGEKDREWLEFSGDSMVAGTLLPARRGVTFRAAEAPSDKPMPDGEWENDELGVRAAVRDGVLRIGRTLELPVTSAAAGLWQADPFILRLEEGALLLSGGGFRRLRFTPAG
ncbi:serine hydrolase domain-containing protein [Nonomuraea sp. NPDC050536]|uniref:serine hydrolase domain-containing protein n=1 Tax=Nonomuraea sp. NPDC050536 TaxID=3364366 RepID=UPI0037CA31DF